MRYNASAVAFLGLVLAALLAVGADPPAAPTPPAATKGKLPANFRRLGLSADQIAAVEKVTAAAHDKIAALEAQLRDIKAQEKRDTLAILNADQKRALAALATGETEPTTPPPTPVSPKP